jgi:hypothetical protein
MWGSIVAFGAALVLAPLGAQGADLVVWWDQGVYPEQDAAVAELISAFEHKTGTDVELVQHPLGRWRTKPEQPSQPGIRQTSSSASASR